ncbi:MAG: hypothetical protein OQK82_07800 [Candidatus Pacearchaeota archaeon]|nr:hypothetical protein [Candidatus Pacearchaeota archaeon]
MFNLFKKKEGEGAESAEASGVEGPPFEGATPAKPATPAPVASSGDVSLGKVAADLEKIKASVEAFTEVRKSFTEKFGRISEQIGELRSMILERDKSIQEIELKAIKAYDLVATVQPEKIMTEMQKQGAKIDALKANLEGNESIMDRVMDELKEAKRKIEFFRGVEEIVKLSEETKQELIEIKKVESRININTDKVETIYAELRKKFQRVDVFDSDLQESKAGIEQSMKDIAFLKDKVVGLAQKSELEALVAKVQRYIDILKDLEKRSSLTRDIGQLKNILESMK